MSGNNDMQNLLRGVVKDHRLPRDYSHHFNQPYHTRAFLKNLKRFFVTRQLTKQNITTPMFVLFVSIICFVLSYLILTHSPLLVLLHRCSSPSTSPPSCCTTTTEPVTGPTCSRVSTGCSVLTTTATSIRLMLTLTTSGTPGTTAGLLILNAVLMLAPRDLTWT